jgi:hypothetical protein
MHWLSSYTTGPSGRTSSAVVGQEETQAGSRQCRQRHIVEARYRPPGALSSGISCVLIRVSVLALRTAGF